jgi:hypothetical protein
VNVPSGYVMNPLMLCPNPIGSLQWILTVGSSDATGVEERLGDRKVVVAVGVAEAAGPQDVRRTRREVATRHRITVERNNSPKGYARSARRSARISAMQ